MTKDIIFGIVGGLGFFLYGMRLMSEGLRRVAGDRMKNILNTLTKTPVVGVLVGTLVTCIIQSSSSTTVIVVGLVNAGLLALRQAISVVMGANIGTTFTAWLVSILAVFKISTYALPAVGIGFLLTVIGKNRRIRYWGQIILGFGILFVGLDFMKGCCKPIGGLDWVRDYMLLFARYPVLGVIFGILITVVLQSSSATIAMMQIMAFNGIISFEMAVPVILGDNIGTTITAQLASVGGNINARRTAMAHTLFNVIGTLYMLVLIYAGVYPKFIQMLIPGDITQGNIMFHIALSHSVFNIINTLVFLPMTGLLEKASVMLAPSREKDAEDFAPRYLEKHLLDSPPLAFNQAKNEMVYMANMSRKAVKDAVESFFKNDSRLVAKTWEREKVTDNLQREISRYLIELSRKELEQTESEGLPVLLHSINDIERVGDLAVNIAELTERKLENKLRFSPESEQEMKNMYQTVIEMTEKVIEGFSKGSQVIAAEALRYEDELNSMQEQFRKNHSGRLNSGKCSLDSGITFIDFIDNLEKIGDHLANIAQSVKSGMRWNGIDREDRPGL